MFHKFELENVAGCIQVTHAIGIIKKAAQSIFSAIGLGNNTKFKGNNVVYSILKNIRNIVAIVKMAAESVFSLAGLGNNPCVGKDNM